MRPVFQVVKSLNELWSCIILAFSAVFCFFGCVEIYQIVSKHDGTWQNKWRWIAICRNIFLWNTSKVIRIDQSLSQYGNSFVAIFGDYRLQDLSISQVIVMWPVKNWSALIGGKFMLKKCFQDFLSSLKAVISTNESTEFITSHVIYKQTYTYKFQLKTTIIYCKKLKTFSLLSNFK